jgi:hypothetical protein
VKIMAIFNNSRPNFTVEPFFIKILNYRLNGFNSSLPITELFAFLFWYSVELCTLSFSGFLIRSCHIVMTS